MLIKFKGLYTPYDAIRIVEWINTHLTDITIAERPIYIYWVAKLVRLKSIKYWWRPNNATYYSNNNRIKYFSIGCGMDVN